MQVYYCTLVQPRTTIHIDTEELGTLADPLYFQ